MIFPKLGCTVLDVENLCACLLVHEVSAVMVKIPDLDQKSWLSRGLALFVRDSLECIQLGGPKATW